jgi:hypothetical protein
VDIRDNVAEVLLEQIEALLGLLAELGRALLLHAGDGIADFLLGRGDAPDNLLALDALERVDLVELLVEQLEVVLLGVLVPCVVHAEGVLQALIVDVVEDPLLVKRLLELLAEPARMR